MGQPWTAGRGDAELTEQWQKKYGGSGQGQATNSLRVVEFEEIFLKKFEKIGL